MIRDSQNDDPSILSRRVAPDIGKIQVSGQNRSASLTSMLSDLRIRCSRQPDVARKLNMMAAREKRANCRPRQISVDEEAHAESNGGERVEGFLLSQVGYEFERGADVVRGEIVFPLDFLKSHPASQATHHYRYWQPSTSDHGFAVTDGGIQDNAVQGSHNGNDRPLGSLVEREAFRKPNRCARPRSEAISFGHNWLILQDYHTFPAFRAYRPRDP